METNSGQIGWLVHKKSDVIYNIMPHRRYCVANIHIPVVHFDQQTGAPHAVCWSKSFVLALKQVFPFFLTQTGKKEGKHKK